MTSYVEQFNLLNKAIEDFKESALNGVVTLFKTIQLTPITIGNIVYFICKDGNGNEVPAYCYKSDFNSLEDLKPIYDRYGDGYGWYYFDSVVKILDEIRNNIMSNL